MPITEEKRVKDFPPRQSGLLPADVIPVDSNAGGTGSVTVQQLMEANISGLTTDAATVIAAINELKAQAFKTIALTQAQYNLLPDTKLTDGISYYITDGVPDVDNSLWTKVGRDPLDTTASDCSGAINELKQSLLEYWSTSATPTVPAGTSGDLEFTIPAAYQSGYRVASYAIYSGSKVVKPYVFEITSTKITYYVENTSGGSIARQITIKVLFQKV